MDNKRNSVSSRPKSSPIGFMFKSLSVLALPLLVVGLFVFGIPRYYYSINDWIKLQNYTPNQEIKLLADDARMTDKGRKIFYVTDPELNEKTRFNANCPFAERSFVLGCFNGHNIYLLSVKDGRLKSVETVTAAHEMLHAAYERLSSEERNRIDSLIESKFKEISDQRLNDLIADYRKQDPESVPNELHSILPTEVKDLGPELEDYYKQYFTDRSKVVDKFQSYESVFSNLDIKIKAIELQIDNLKIKISQLDESIRKQRVEIDSQNALLKKYRDSGDIASYNAQVPKQNQLVNSYNNDVREYNSSIETHNAKAKEVNEIVVQQNSLVNSIDSKFNEL